MQPWEAPMVEVQWPGGPPYESFQEEPCSHPAFVTEVRRTGGKSQQILQKCVSCGMPWGTLHETEPHQEPSGTGQQPSPDEGFWKVLTHWAQEPHAIPSE
jgi:hypothetical protein